MVIDIFKNKNKKLTVLLILILSLCLARHYYNSGKVFYPASNESKQIIDGLNYSCIKSENLMDICMKTGLSPYVVKGYIQTKGFDFLEHMRSVYCKTPDYEKQYIFYPFTIAERNTTLKTPIASLKNGDILLTFNTHTLDWRHGHCAIVVDEVNGKIVEHTSIGNNSTVSDAYEWGRYPSFVVLRYPDEAVAEKAAQYARNNLEGTKYSLFAGVFGVKNNTEKSNCSHIIWLAYYYAGVDIDSNGGKIVTPGNILSCTSLKVVQLFGMDNSELKTRWLMP